MGALERYLQLSERCSEQHFRLRMGLCMGPGRCWAGTEQQLDAAPARVPPAAAAVGTLRGDRVLEQPAQLALRSLLRDFSIAVHLALGLDRAIVTTHTVSKLPAASARDVNRSGR